MAMLRTDGITLLSGRTVRLSLVLLAASVGVAVAAVLTAVQTGRDEWFSLLLALPVLHVAAVAAAIKAVVVARRWAEPSRGPVAVLVVATALALVSLSSAVVLVLFSVGMSRG